MPNSSFLIAASAALLTSFVPAVSADGPASTNPVPLAGQKLALASEGPGRTVNRTAGLSDGTWTYPLMPQTAALYRDAQALTMRRYPLHWAAIQDQADAVEALVELGNPVDARDIYGRTPLMAAAVFDSRDAAVALLALGADATAFDSVGGEAAIHFAAGAGRTRFIELLSAHGAPIETPARASGNTPLHLAAAYGHHKTIMFLVDRGADPNVTNYDGVSPIFFASKRLRGRTVDLLRRLGARQGGMFEAVNANDLVRVQRLIAAGADVNETRQGGTPLHLAASKGYLGIVGILVDNGADITAPGEPAGAMPLHAAALSNQARVAEFLIERGAPVDALDREGRTPLIIASIHGGVETVTVLLANKSGAEVEDDIYGFTPIHWAACSGQAAVVRQLAKSGVDLQRKARDGRSPLRIAVEKRRQEVIAVLAANGVDIGEDDRLGPVEAGHAGLHKILPGGRPPVDRR